MRNQDKSTLSDMQSAYIEGFSYANRQLRAGVTPQALDASMSHLTHGTDRERERLRGIQSAIQSSSRAYLHPKQ